MSKGAALFNFVRQESTGNFVEVVPEANENNIGDISNILFNSAYSPLLNEFVGNLINRIGLTIIENKMYSNPLKMFKKGSMPLGSDVQEIVTNPAEAEQYAISDSEMAKLLKVTTPDTKAAYYRRNRKDVYTQTIAREALQAAFVSWAKFEDYVASITNSLYSGCYIDEFKYTKGLIAGAYSENKAVIKTVTAVTDQSSAKAFVMECRKLFSLMSFPSSDYNAYKKITGDSKARVTWTDSSRVVLLVRSDVMAVNDVESLAAAFNMDKANFLGRVVVVDKFDEAGKIQAIICDEAWFKIYDNIFRFDSFYNPRVMAWNFYLHAWGTYAISPFANAVILATEQPAVAYTGLEFGKDSVTIAQGDHEGLDMTVAPLTGNAEINYSVTAFPAGGAATDLTLTKSNNDRHVDIAAKADADTGNYTVTATTGSGAAAITDTITVAVEASA